MDKKLLDYFKNDELAANVWESKYQMKNLEGLSLEDTPLDMHKRLIKEFVKLEIKNVKKDKKKLNNRDFSVFGKEYINSCAQMSEEQLEEYLLTYLDKFKFIIPQGSIMAMLGHRHRVGSLSNCFVISSPEDSYGGILYTDQQMVQLMKRRGGVGTNLNKLRPSKAIVKNAAGTSTGVPSFAERYSNTTREVAQDGRRGALMLLLDVRHPDIFKFVSMKQDRTKVTGANVSVMLTDEFMKAVVEDNDFICKFPIELDTDIIYAYPEVTTLEYNKVINLDEGIYVMKIKARELYDFIIEMAWENAEPGVAFIDRVNDYAPDGVYFTINKCNPCFHPDTLIETVNGRMKIKDIKKPVKVYSMDESGRLCISQASSSFISKRNAKTLKITLENDNYIIITPNHKLFVHNKGWIEAKDLQIKDRIAHLSRDRRGSKYSGVYLTTDPDKGGYSNRVLKIEEDEIIDVYDIQVENTHCLIANNMVAHNCGEQWLNDNDSCRLFALNLYSIVSNAFTKKARINYDLLYNIAYVQQRLADILVDLEIEYIDNIISKIEQDPESPYIKEIEINLWKEIKITAQKYRRTGCGITGLADMLAGLNLSYNSKEAKEIIANVMKCKMEAELDCTIDLAISRGAFSVWNKDLEFKVTPAGKDNIIEGLNPFYEFICNEFTHQANKMFKYGRRNISWSTVAPTGSVSLMTQTTSGLEPLFAPYYKRRKKVNPNDKDVKVDFIDQNGDAWAEFIVVHPKLNDWILFYNKTNKENLNISTEEQAEKAYKLSPWYKCTANDIDWKDRIEIQHIIQKYTTNAISCTINLPENVSKNVVSNIYLEGWKLGLKGTTVYRDNCRTGVLVHNTSKVKEVAFSQNDAVKRPKTLVGEGYIVVVKGVEYIVLIGLLDNKPYEVFSSINKWDLPKYFNCDIIKKGKGKYNIDIKDILLIEDFSHEITDEEAVITRLLSTSLRHGTDIKFICEQLSKADGNMVSFSKAVLRTLKRYIKEGEKSGIKCNECNSSNVIYEEGCSKCRDCGSSKCG